MFLFNLSLTGRPWPWPWLSPHPSGCIRPHSNATLVCWRRTTGSVSSQIRPNLCRSSQLCFSSLSLAVLVLSWIPEPPSTVLATQHWLHLTYRLLLLVQHRPQTTCLHTFLSFCHHHLPPAAPKAHHPRFFFFQVSLPATPQSHSSSVACSVHCGACLTKMSSILLSVYPSPFHHLLLTCSHRRSQDFFLPEILTTWLYEINPWTPKPSKLNAAPSSTQ